MIAHDMQFRPESQNCTAKGVHGLIQIWYHNDVHNYERRARVKKPMPRYEGD